MKKLKISLSQRQRHLCGLITPRSMKKENYLLRAGLLLILLLPWVGLCLGFMESWRTYDIGDEISVPWWAWFMVVVLPVLAVLLARCTANRIVLQWMLRNKNTRKE